jgi:hypothetical protein
MCSSIPTQEEGLARCSDLFIYFCGEFLPFCKKHFEKKLNFFSPIHFFWGKEIAKI